MLLYIELHDWIRVVDKKSPSFVEYVPSCTRQLLMRLFVYYLLPLHVIHALYYNNTVTHIRNRNLDSGDVKKKD